MSATAEVKTPPSANLTVGELGAMIAKGRKPASPPATDQDADEETPSEQAALADESAKTETEIEQAAKAAPETEAKADEVQEEQNTEAEAKTTEDEDKAGADDEAQAPKAKAVRDLRDRVHKVVDQRDAERNARIEVERKLADAEAKLASQTNAPAANQRQQAAQTNEEFASDPAVVEIDRTLADVEAFLDFAAQHPDGGSFEDGGKTYELDAEQMRAFKAKSEKERIRLSSKREARLESARQTFQTQRAAAHAEAVKLYPWIELKDSAEFQEAIRLIRANPGVMQHADFELVVARQVAGTRLEAEARKKLNGSTGKPAGSRTPAPVVTRSGEAAPRVNGTDKQAKATETQFRSTGKVDDLAKMLAERKRARMQPA